LEKIDEEKIKEFLLNKQSKNYSSQTINLYLNAIKFFYREVLKIPQRINPVRNSNAMFRFSCALA